MGYGYGVLIHWKFLEIGRRAEDDVSITTAFDL
jgi:hypothetical protein